MAPVRPAKDSLVLRHATKIAVGAVSLVMLLLLAMFGRQMEIRESTKGWVSHTYEVMWHIELLLGKLRDAEIGHRGFIITQNADFLRPYDNALKDSTDLHPAQVSFRKHSSIAQELTYLRQLTADNPVQQANLEKLGDKIEKLLEYFANTISQRQVEASGSPGPALDLERGEALMDEIRALAGSAEEEESRLLVLRTDMERTINSESNHRTLIIMLGFYAALMLGIWLYQRSRAHAEAKMQVYTQALERRGEELQTSNEALRTSNILVAERTVNLEAAKAELERSNQELDQFAYVASHDLKAPLRVIQNASNWLEHDLRERLAEKEQKYLTLLRSRAQRMEKLLDDLLDYAKIGRSTDERYNQIVSGADLIHDVIELLTPPPSFTIEVAPAFAAIHVAKMPLQQVFHNLVNNAIKHHDRGGGTISLEAERLAGHYRFTVSDDGPGIPPQYQRQIFEMFRTLKPRDEVEGSGMGLSVIKKAIEQRGGTIEVVSGNGRGAAFAFTWPDKQQAAIADEAA